MGQPFFTLPLGNITLLGVTLTEENHVTTSRDLRICNGQIRELVIGKLNHEIAGKLVQSVNVLRESYVGKCQQLCHTLLCSPPLGSSQK